MKAQYFSTFITGFEKVVEEALKNTLRNVRVDLLLDGLVVYSTTSSINSIKKLKFINNTFLLIEKFEDLSDQPMDKMMKYALNKINFEKALNISIPRKYRTFRVIASKENQLVSVNKKLLSELEDILSIKLKLKVNRSLPDIEVWFLTRSEGLGLIGLRITKTPNYEKTLHKGELRPELASLMCVLAELEKTDVIFDPFSGYGAIPLECAKGFKVKQIIAGEKDEKVFKLLQDKTKKMRPKIIVERWDAINLSSLTDNSVDKIITDPPWGLFDENIDLRKFYKRMLEEFTRILSPKGLLIILTAQKELIENLINQSASFKLIEKYNVLVSGKKASIYKLQN
ncbi:RsmD family RNA methyltransferase [Patescibacteria group bacterium]